MTKTKILIIINIFLIIISFKFFINFSINTSLINKYNSGEYNDGQAKTLKIINVIQPYIAYYNLGNIYYQTGKYEEAINEYKNALNTYVPKYKECNIRINYVLAICKTVQVDEKDEESIKEAIKKYESAIDILTEDGCANKNDNNGHNEKAEKLKKDIQDEIDRLKKLLDEDTSSSEENEEKEEKQEEIQIEEEKIQQIKEEAIREQREIESRYENYNSNYNSNKKNW